MTYNLVTDFALHRAEEFSSVALAKAINQQLNSPKDN